MQVYGLLDRSWDQFIGFCDAYNAAGRRLQALAAAACQAAVVPAAVDAIGNERLAEQVFDLQEQLQQLETDKEQADDVCLSLERQLQQLKKDKAKADADVASVLKQLQQLRSGKAQADAELASAQKELREYKSTKVLPASSSAAAAAAAPGSYYKCAFPKQTTARHVPGKKLQRKQQRKQQHNWCREDFSMADE